MRTVVPMIKDHKPGPCSAMAPALKPAMFIEKRPYTGRRWESTCTPSRRSITRVSLLRPPMTTVNIYYTLARPQETAVWCSSC